MVALEERWATGGESNPGFLVILAILFMALIAIGALWGDFRETWMNGTAL